MRLPLSLLPSLPSSLLPTLVCSLGFVIAIGCSTDIVPTPQITNPPARDGGGPDEEEDADGSTTTPGKDSGPKKEGGTSSGGPASGTIRIVAANITSGNNQTYDPGEGIRIFQGLHPDIAMVQEMNYKTNSTTDIEELVTTAFGAEYTHYVEPGVQIPNGIVSRYPITESGRWADPNVDNRGFAYAKISIPGPHPLWAVSVHLLTSGSANRNSEATALVAEIKKVVTAGDYVAIGGDFNTDSRTEPCITKFSEVTTTTGPFPADEDDNDTTNATRTKTYDWVLVDSELKQHEVPTKIGAKEFANGLVFDSRVYEPLTDVAPVLKTDSAAENMQHLPVVRDFFVD